MKLARTLIAATLATAALGAGTLLAGEPAQAATPKPCVLHVALFEDGSWAGDAVILHGHRIADHWRVTGPEQQGIITPDEYGRLSYGTAWAPGVDGQACGFAYDR